MAGMSSAWQSVLAGLPILVVHLLLTTGLLLGGLALYAWLAPYRELELIREGNVAGAVVLSGQTLGLVIPLGMMLATAVNIPDIILWGAITVVLQFIAIGAVRLSIRHLPALIKRGDIAPALLLACAQIAAGILTASALAR
jgi:putative membrane protein